MAAARFTDADETGRVDAPRSRSRLLALCIALLFAVVSGQLVWLASQSEGQSSIRVAMMSSPATTYARPDIVDRNGRLLAADVQLPSLYALGFRLGPEWPERRRRGGTGDQGLCTIPAPCRAFP